MAEKAVSRLPDVEHRAAQLVEERDRLDQEIAGLRAQVQSLQAAPAERGRVQEEIGRVESELPGAEEAARAVGGEAGWLRQLEDARQAKSREEDLLADLRTRVEKESGAGEELAAARRALDEMGDPAGRGGDPAAADRPGEAGRRALPGACCQELGVGQGGRGGGCSGTRPVRQPWKRR